MDREFYVSRASSTEGSHGEQACRRSIIRRVGREPGLRRVQRSVGALTGDNALKRKSVRPYACSWATPDPTWCPRSTSSAKSSTTSTRRAHAGLAEERADYAGARGWRDNRDFRTEVPGETFS